jgi:site-specific recombinase
MPFFQKKNRPNLIHLYQQEGRTISHGNRSAALAYLRDFVSLVRPSGHTAGEADQNLERVMALLDESPAALHNLRRAIFVQIRDANLIPMFTESGMAMSRSFGKELSSRLKHKLIPPLRDERDFLQVVNHIFYEPQDYQWVQQIRHETWTQFLAILGLTIHGAEKALSEQVFLSLQMMSAGVAQLGWERDVYRFLPGPLRFDLNPFMLQQEEINKMGAYLKSGHQDSIIAQGLTIKKKLEQCLMHIRQIRENTQERGASLTQSFILFQMEQKLNRMLLLTDFIDADNRIHNQRFATFFMSVVRNENRKYSIRELFSQSAGYLAYQIAEQKGRKGNAYITSTPAEYWAMIYSAIQGGFIICFVAIFKNLLGWLQLAPFWQGFVYSVNYSAGFIAIEETRSTLATKQPAFTANAVAASVDSREHNGAPNLYNLAVTIAKVSRSQFASFLGNLVVVFPGTFVLAWLFHQVFGFRIVSGEEAMQLLKGQHPFLSLSWLYACNTGVFLFLSGLISGYVQNKMKFGAIGERIIRHPVLRFYASPEKLKGIAQYWNTHAGSILGSVSLGFFLGMASVVGKVFGMPFDIRHVTIAAGNASIGLYGANLEELSPGFLAAVLLGVLGIGFFNFLVSFSLAFTVALRSRGLSMRHFPAFMGILWRYFRSRPLDFIRPRKRISG